MQEKDFRTRRITYMAMLVAISFVLKSLLGYEQADWAIRFYDVPLFITGIMFGPVYGLLAGLMTDTLHILWPLNFATMYNLMTLSSMSWGLAGGLFFHGKKHLSKQFLAGVVIVVSLFSFTVISIQLYGPQRYFFFGLSPIPGMFMRFGVLLITLPLRIYLIRTLFDRVIAPNHVYQFMLEDQTNHS